MKQDNRFVKYWIKQGENALSAAKIYEKAGLHEEAHRILKIGHYCMKRYDKAQLKFISARRERTQQTAGTVLFIIILVAIIHYFLTH